ncbi:BlaI/MecI/CopY family transcriptional regulator [Streptomyces venezuelae]|uniref:BlaI/MecI/CopY family transcriptional regulator n=1 Tax=Streptomyces venezuelae TaxID=54571 RepID=UPI003453969B
MTDAQPETPGVQAQYAARVAADLETNRKEQERIGAEVAALQEQLQALENDHAVLLSMQQALGSPAPATGKAKQQASRPQKAVPAPRTSNSNSRPTRPSRSKKAVATKDKPTPNSPKTKTKAKTQPQTQTKQSPSPKAGPTLVELIDDHLVQQNEPRSAAEITTALAQALPDRTVKTTVVRTTVEGLVAKGRVQRTKQGSSVFYTSAAPTEQSATPQPETSSAN